MKILFAGRNYSQGLKNSDPTNYMSVAESLGHVCVDGLAAEPDVLVCIDYHQSAISLARRARRTGIKAVLICCEPSVVLPQNYQSRVTKCFDTVIKVGRVGPPLIKWPQTWREMHKSTDRVHRAIMVNSDKWSFVRGQLYWLRAAIGSQDDRLDTAGVGWNRSYPYRFILRSYEFFRTLYSRSFPKFTGIKYALASPLRYVGAPRDKVEFMSNYSVAVVIENSQELITEKLFDAWFAGCVPVYVGPNLKQFGIPCDLVVQSEPEIKSLILAIDKALEIDREKFMDSLDTYLNTTEARSWQSNEAMVVTLSKSII